VAASQRLFAKKGAGDKANSSKHPLRLPPDENKKGILQTALWGDRERGPGSFKGQRRFETTHNKMPSPPKPRVRKETKPL